MSDPTNRFTGLANLYASHRPDYPADALDFVLRRCGLGPGSVLVDVGCGTGISSRAFAARGLSVVGIEPNADMRRQAQSAAAPPDVPAPVYRDGTAEATGLADHSADAVLAAQAFHWFDAPAALREFRRVLKPGGAVALMWNERDESDPFTAAYGAVIRTAPNAAAVESSRARAGEALLRDPLFADGDLSVFGHRQTLNEEGLLGRAFSASYAPREAAAAEAFAAALQGVFARYQNQGWVAVRYVTSVYTARARLG